MNELTGVWLDGGLYNIMNRIEAMQTYFITQGKIVAVICFVISLGIGAIKIALGGTDMNKEFTKTLLTVVTFYVAMWAFPSGMKALQTVTSTMAFEAVAKNGLRTAFPEKGPGSEYEFIHFVAKMGGDIWKIEGGMPGQKQSIDQIRNGELPEGKYVTKALKLNITNTKTGLISINKVFILGFASFLTLWQSAIPPGVKGLDVFNFILDIIIVTLVAVVHLICLIFALIQYIMALLDFSFLYAIGIFFIPFMLWDGTKFLFERLIGSIITISIKLMVLAIALYLVVVVTVDIYKNMYQLNLTQDVGIAQRMEMYVTVLFMSALLFVIAKNAPAVASFLAGGQPSLSLGEFAGAVKNMGAAANAVKGAAGAAGKVGKGAVAGAAGVAGAMGNAAQSAFGAAGAEKGAGMGLMGQLGAAAQAGTSSLAKSTVNGVAGAAEKGIKAVGNVPSALKNIASTAGNVLAPGSFGGGGGKGSGGKGGGNSGGNSGGSHGFTGDEKATKTMQETATRNMNSNNGSTRMEGMKQQFQANKMDDKEGRYQGVGGTLRNGLDSFKALNNANMQDNRAGGSFKPSAALQKQMDFVGPPPPPAPKK